MQQNYLPSTHAEYCKSLNWNLLVRFNVCCILFLLCSSLIQWKIIKSGIITKCFKGYKVLTDFLNLLNSAELSLKFAEFKILELEKSYQFCKQSFNFPFHFNANTLIELSSLEIHQQVLQKISFLRPNDLISIHKTTKCFT